MLYSLPGSILSVGILIKYTKVVGSQPITHKQVKTCVGSKKVTPNCIYYNQQKLRSYFTLKIPSHGL